MYGLFGPSKTKRKCNKEISQSHTSQEINIVVVSTQEIVHLMAYHSYTAQNIFCENRKCQIIIKSMLLIKILLRWYFILFSSPNIYISKKMF